MCHNPDFFSFFKKFLNDFVKLSCQYSNQSFLQNIFIQNS